MVFGYRLQAPASIVRSIGRHVDTMERAHEFHERYQVQSAQRNNFSLPTITLASLLLAAQSNNIITAPDAMPSVIAASALMTAPFQSAASLASEQSGYSTLIGDPVSQVSDHRRFTPTDTSFADLRGGQSRSQVGNAYSKALPYGIAFSNKTGTLVCIRRHTRRDVIMALGKGGGNHKPPRRNHNSNIWC